MIKEILKISEDLIRIPSTKDNPDSLLVIVDYIETYFKGKKGIILERFEDNSKPSLIIKNFEGIKGDIILNGHLDVVPASSEGDYEPIYKDGRMYARGAIDMKVSDAILIKAFEEYVKNDNSKKIILMLTTDEEVGGFSGTDFLLKKGYSADVVIIPDSGSPDEIVIAEKGVVSAEFKTIGKSCHSARPWLGSNPIDKVISFYAEAKREIEDREKLYSEGHWGSSLNLNVISGGTATNQIPDSISFKLDIRYTEVTTSEEIHKILLETGKKYDTEIVSIMLAPCFFVDENNEFLLKYKGIAENEMSNKISLVKEHGASDARFFQDYNMPVIFQRPSGGNLHTNDEYVEIDSIEKIYNAFYKFMTS